MQRLLRRIAAAVLCTATALLAHGADWPTRAVRLVVPFSAGGPTDTAARTVAERMAAMLGQPVVIENRPGADGAIAAQWVAAAPADGHTLLVATSSVMALPRLADPPPFAPGALVPVAAIGRYGFALFVHPDVPAKSVAEFVQQLRSRPGEWHYGVANASETVAAALFQRATGTSMVRVPYKGAAQAMPDLLAGRIQAYFTPINAGLGYAREGKLRMLATLLPERSALAPDVPTLAQSGLPDIEVPSQQLIAAPAAVPEGTRQRIAAALDAALTDPAVRSRLGELGLSVERASGEGLVAMVRASDAEYARLSVSAGAK